MNRIDLLQGLLNKKKGQTYLEIGIFVGACFIPIKCETKIGVDMRPPVEQVQNILDDKTKYFQMSSDEFFEKHGSIFSTKKIDVAFVDGFHSYKQSLRDVENCLNYLNEDGVIVMHDCNPSSATLATPFDSYEEKNKAGCRGNWTGDVWKTIVHLRSQRNDLNVMVLDQDFGLGVITKGKPEKVLGYKLKVIEQMGYDALAAKRDLLLNLKSPDYSNGFLRGLDF